MRRHGWWLTGLVLVVGGAWLALAARAPRDFGWFAYTPGIARCSSPCVGLSFARDGDGSLLLVTPGTLVGLGVAVTGLLLLSGALGYRLGRRRTPSSSPRA